MKAIKRHKVVQPKDQSIKLIPLTKKLNTIVDAFDYEFLMQWNWHAFKGKDGKFYAARGDKNSHKIFMHRVLLNHKSHDTDHKNRDTLDNRRLNLRPCTRSQNNMNKVKQKNNICGFKGVHKVGQRWRAMIMHTHIGYFATRKDAALAYDVAAKKHFGKFARTNL